MKYGILANDASRKHVISSNDFTNIGAFFMEMALENILYELGVDKKDIVYIHYDDLKKYDESEYLILLINNHWIYHENEILFSSMPRVIPVFLSASTKSAQISSEQAEYLRRYEPIGCRDEHTMHIFRSRNIDAFVMGCLTATFDNREKLPTQNKVFFADVPYGVYDYIPDEIKADVEFIDHEMLISDLPSGMTAREYAETIMKRYITEARLVVSSRFHAAMIALAYGIPIILVNEKFTFRFSTLCNLIPKYISETFSQIEWKPPVVDIESMKTRMKNIAKKRIIETISKYGDTYTQSELLEYPEWETAGQIDYFEEAIEYIKRSWSKEEKIKYAIWGFNDNARAIAKFIESNYCNSKLVAIYDTNTVIKYNGISSVTPDNIDPDADIFIFVTSFIAGFHAKQLFQEIGITNNNYFVCDRRYVKKEDFM